MSDGVRGFRNFLLAFAGMSSIGVIIQAGVPWWLLVSGWLAVPVGMFVMGYRQFARDIERRKKGLCPDCGYDLTGNVSGVCPECGRRLGRSR